ncbi:MAG: ImmA/IrrE family metallo-endopeptidase [Bacteroidetes bacterium]|nr:ImmA/IrrE family metallo-endopeptidase [Bacteroidota bacterium]
MVFRGEKLKSARIMAGMSLQDLADAMPGKVSKQAIYKFESGNLIPNSITTGYLAGILNVPECFFERPQYAQLGLIEFRNVHSKVSAKEHAMIREQSLDFVSRYIELEQLLQFEDKFENPIKDIAIADLADIETTVYKLRSQWRLGSGPLSGIIELLEKHGIKILEIEAGDGFDGLQTFEVYTDTPVLVLNKSHFKSNDRKRFTVLHELGHLLLPLDQYPLKVRERFCNAFAGTMLLPGEDLIREFGGKRNNLSFEELGAVKQNYGISMQAILYRLRESELITETYFKQFMFMINQFNYKIVEPYPYHGDEKATRFNQLLSRGLAEKVFSVEKAAELKNMRLLDFMKEQSQMLQIVY